MIKLALSALLLAQCCCHCLVPAAGCDPRDKSSSATGCAPARLSGRRPAGQPTMNLGADNDSKVAAEAEAAAAAATSNVQEKPFIYRLLARQKQKEKEDATTEIAQSSGPSSVVLRAEIPETRRGEPETATTEAVKELVDRARTVLSFGGRPKRETIDSDYENVTPDPAELARAKAKLEKDLSRRKNEKAVLAGTVVAAEAVEETLKDAKKAVLKDSKLNKKTKAKEIKELNREIATAATIEQAAIEVLEEIPSSTTSKPSRARIGAIKKTKSKTTTTTTTTTAPAEEEDEESADLSADARPAKGQQSEPKARDDNDSGKGLPKPEVTSSFSSSSTSPVRSFKKKKPLIKLLSSIIKEKNDTVCTPEAYLEFPRDIFGNAWRARGLVIIHVAVVCYMFYSLALVCERYFMPSLEEFAQRLKLSEDVAGATLMSAGSSAPELFTAILGVFVAKGDVGTGAIVGSAVFNILFVIGICAFVSTTSAQLNWWPVLRDSVFYTFTVLVLIMFIYDEKITALESFLMIALYGVYISIMIYNETIKEMVSKALMSYPLTAKLISTNASSASVDGLDDVFGSSSSHPQSSASQRNFFANQPNPRNYQTTSMATTPAGDNQHYSAQKTTSIEDDSMFLAACLVIVQHKRLFCSQLRFQAAARYIICKRQHRMQQQSRQKSQKCSNEVNYFGPESEPLNKATSHSSNQQRERMEAYAKTASLSKNKFSIVSKDDYEFWNRPPAEGENYYLWLAKIPVNYVLHYTIPDCTLYPDKYLFTFIISICWTAFFSYLMVWMVTLIGFTLGIPDSVMGFTFLAAGTSVPDCYSSIHAARNGMADMAVSNSIGSNVFDILIGLSLPWFIHTALYPGVTATINSRGIIYSVILLFFSLITTIYLLNKYEWTLKPRLGLALLIAYGLFIALTCMLEFNLLGHVNPPACEV